eukprot:TRINITY_DN139_c0_g1_i2.p1 TRINITY_DN139_c0_g1~~TRINITY_DN139_c0_g1_i2.p1  ORF type:complete len:137 (-),score=13.65 TRINITY_DN139_c0_g1_i2:339-749(-)
MEVATSHFAAITEAHEVLSHKVNRRIYDMSGPSEGLRTWRTNSNEIPFRRRILKSWGPMIVLQGCILGALLMVKDNAEDTKVEIHGGSSPYMPAVGVEHNTSSSIGSSLNQFRTEQKKSKVITWDSPEPFRQPRNR